MGNAMKLDQTMPSPEKRIEKLFKHMDSNKDGKLSLSEFIEGARNDPSILSLLRVF